MLTITWIESKGPAFSFGPANYFGHEWGSWACFCLPPIVCISVGRERGSIEKRKPRTASFCEIEGCLVFHECSRGSLRSLIEPSPRIKCELEKAWLFDLATWEPDRKWRDIKWDLFSTHMPSDVMTQQHPQEVKMRQKLPVRDNYPAPQWNRQWRPSLPHLVLRTENDLAEEELILLQDDD